MLFLTKDWSKDNGGCFKDCQQTEEKPEDTHVPEFNTLLAFHVPRLYQITPVLAEAANRKCVFGWFLQVKVKWHASLCIIPLLQPPLSNVIKQQLRAPVPWRRFFPRLSWQCISFLTLPWQCYSQEGELYDLAHASEQPSLSALKAKKKKKNKAKAKKAPGAPKELVQLAKQRQEARKAGKYDVADKIRDQLKAAGCGKPTSLSL
jgi:hypothetical protein